MSLEARLRLARGGFRLDVELGARSGETLVVVGPNGAGKSTLVATLAGLVPLDEGRVVLDGEALEDTASGVRRPPQARRVGVLFQARWLFPGLSVQDNAGYGLVSRGLSRREARRRAATWLERLAIAHLARRHPKELSGGEAQRVALARALAAEPRLLLLDEPLAALDAEQRPRTLALLQQVLTEFTGNKLVITHDPLEARLLGERLLILEAGRSVQQGTADELQRRPASPYVATLLGANLLVGRIRESEGRSLLECDGATLVVPHGALPAGSAALASISPRAIALSVKHPESSARNVLAGAIESLDLVDDRVRVRLGTRPPLTAEVTAEAATELGLAVGKPIWASLKATEIDLYPR